MTVISAGVTVAQRTTGSRDAALGKAVFDSSVRAQVQEVNVPKCMNVIGHAGFCDELVVLYL